MTLTRRTFLQASTASAALTIAACNTLPGAPTLAPPLEAQAGPAVQALTENPATPPPLEILALSHMAYGINADDLARIRNIGFESYVDEQLNPVDDDDERCFAELDKATLYIEHGDTDTYEAVEEERALQYRNAGVADLWKLTDEEADVPWEEMYRPLNELKSETWIRAVYSKWQLREVIVEFWHNHFNVNSEVDDSRVAIMYPHFNREVIRKNAFGNFRTFVEAVATHPTMLYYLNNASSRTGPPNENFARELFELHTLGAANYLNQTYNHQREVPRDDNGVPVGYIDEDVYEAARAFTGWTVADGLDTYEGTVFPNTGEFYYYEDWHDHYQKRILGVEFDPHLKPLEDGRKVLDTIAFHPGTARHLCTKLCQRLVADTPPESLVDQAVATWMATQNEPDQLKQVLRTILLSPEFAATWGQKVKRPFELVVSFLRGTDMPFMPNDAINWYVHDRGYYLFSWPAPNGHPDNGNYWMSTNVMLGRWNLLLALVSDWMEVGMLDVAALTPDDLNTAQEVVEYWVGRLLGYALPKTTMDELLHFAAQNRQFTRPIEYDDDDDRRDRLNHLVAMIGMTPEFQWR